MSPPVTPTSPGPDAEPVEALASVWEPSMNRFRLLAVCLANLGNALSDGAAGALIPYMEKCVLPPQQRARERADEGES